MTVFQRNVALGYCVTRLTDCGCRPLAVTLDSSLIFSQPCCCDATFSPTTEALDVLVPFPTGSRHLPFAFAGAALFRLLLLLSESVSDTVLCRSHQGCYRLHHVTFLSSALRNSIATGLLGICESRKLVVNYFRLSWYSVSSCSYANAINCSPETSRLMRIFNAVILLTVSSLVWYLVSYSCICLQTRELQSRLLPGHGGLAVHESLVCHCADSATFGVVLAAQLEPR